MVSRAGCYPRVESLALDACACQRGQTGQKGKLTAHAGSESTCAVARPTSPASSMTTNVVFMLMRCRCAADANIDAKPRCNTDKEIYIQTRVERAFLSAIDSL